MMLGAGPDEGLDVPSYRIVPRWPAAPVGGQAATTAKPNSLVRQLAAPLATIARWVAGRLDRKRPPDQLVVISFDDCHDLDQWQDWSDFAARHPTVRFTFFVSGAGLIPDERRGAYHGPGPGTAPGIAEVPFGGPADEVRRRFGFMTALRKGGHEIASHGVGHFRGGAWPRATWQEEFDAFDQALGTEAPSAPNGDWASSPGQGFPIAGFRAPYLSTGEGLYEALAAGGFTYDASFSGQWGWPEKDEGGVWRFGLSSETVAGTRRNALAMDYNIRAVQVASGWSAEPGEMHGRSMLATYLAAFRTRYESDRTPLQIGHHFSDYSRGTYQQALMAFIAAVSALPEVRFVTYSDLVVALERRAGRLGTRLSAPP